MDLILSEKFLLRWGLSSRHSTWSPTWVLLKGHTSSPPKSKGSNSCGTQDCVQLWLSTFTYRKSICCQIPCAEIQRWAKGGVGGTHCVGQQVILFLSAKLPWKPEGGFQGLARVSSFLLCSPVRKGSQVLISLRRPVSPAAHTQPADTFLAPWDWPVSPQVEAQWRTWWSF